MTKGHPAIPRLKNKDIVRAIVRVLERMEKEDLEKVENKK